jgi:hypothetical protein
MASRKGKNWHIQGNVNQDTWDWIKKHQGDRSHRGFIRELVELGIESMKVGKALHKEIS